MKTLALFIFFAGFNAFAAPQPIVECPADNLSQQHITNVTISTGDQADVFNLVVTKPTQAQPQTYQVKKPAQYTNSAFTVYSGGGVRLTVLNFDAADADGRYKGYFEDGTPEPKGVSCSIK